VIPHANIILVLLSWLLCFFPAGDALTLSRQRKRAAVRPVVYRGAMVAASLLFLLTYTLAAARRVAESGVWIYLDDSILYATATRDAELGAAGGWGIRTCESYLGAWALRIGFPIVTLFELLSPLCLFSRSFRWIWIIVMAPFHVGTGLLMGIWFTHNMALMPALVAGFDPLRDLRLRTRS